MKRVGLLPLFSSLSLALFLSCPASLSQASGSYDFSDNTGDQCHTSGTITGQVHDNMGYNWNTGTGTGNSQSGGSSQSGPNGASGGVTVQNYFGNTSKQQPPNALQSASQSLLSGTSSTYPFADTSFTDSQFTYGFNQNGSGVYTGVDYNTETANGNTITPSPLNPTGTGAANVNTVDTSSFGAGAALSESALGLTTGITTGIGISTAGIGINTGGVDIGISSGGIGISTGGVGINIGF
jgi:hypothetical protein